MKAKFKAWIMKEMQINSQDTNILTYQTDRD